MKPTTRSAQATPTNNDDDTKATRSAPEPGMSLSDETKRTVVTVVVTAVVVAVLAILLQRLPVQADHCPAPVACHFHAAEPSTNSLSEDLELDGERKCLEHHDPDECSWECCGGRRHSKLFKMVSALPMDDLFYEDRHPLQEIYEFQTDNDRCCMTSREITKMVGTMEDTTHEKCNVIKLYIKGRTTYQFAATGTCAQSEGQNLCKTLGKGQCEQQTRIVPLLCFTSSGKLDFRNFNVNSYCSCTSKSP